MGMCLLLLCGVVLAASAPDASTLRNGYAFGSNTQSQLGLAMSTPVYLSPSEFPLFPKIGITNVSSGLSHTVALSDTGFIYRWGNGERGQLGGVTKFAYAPELLMKLEAVMQSNGVMKEQMWTRPATQVVAGGYHTLALSLDSRVWSWGDNRMKQLGVEVPSVLVKPEQLRVLNVTTTTSRPRPRPAQQILGAPNTTLPPEVFVKSNLRVLPCNSSACSAKYEAKDFTPTPQNVAIPTTSAVVSVHASLFRSAALTMSGQVWVWGDNRDGLMGVDSDDDFILPSLVIGDFKKVTKIVMGSDFFVALDVDRQVWVWGDNSRNQLGLGEGSKSSVDVPTLNQLMTSHNITHLSAGYQHTLGWNPELHRVFAFGDNEFGQLGLGDFDSHACAEEITFLAGKGIVSLQAGRAHNLLLTSNGGVLVWGLNNQGQLGMGDTTTRNLPTRVIALESQGLLKASLGYATSYVWSGPVKAPAKVDKMVGSTATARVPT